MNNVDRRPQESAPDALAGEPHPGGNDPPQSVGARGSVDGAPATAESTLDTDTAGVITKCDRAAERLLGSEGFFLIGRPITMYIPIDGRLMFRRVLNRLSERSEIAVNDWPVLMWDTKRQVFQAHMSARIDSDGNSPRIHWKIRDITDSPGFEEQLHLNLHVLEKMTEGVVVVDHEGWIKITNPAMHTLAGYEAGELVGHHISIFNLYPWPVESAIRPVLRRASNSGQWTGEFQNRRRDGTTFVGRARITPLRSELGSFFLILQKDITKDLTIAAALRGAHSQLARVVNAVDDGIWEWNLVNSGIEISPRGREILGLPEGKLRLSPRECWERTHPDDRPALLRALEEHIANRTPRVRVEQRVRREDGSWAWVRLRGGIVRDKNGRPELVAGALTDVTSERQVQDQLRAQRDELAHAGRQNMIAELAAGMAHELNQPLAAITNYAKAMMLRLQSAKADPDQIADAFDRIAGQALRAGEIIRRLRTLMHRGETRLEFADVNALVRGTLGLLEPETLAGCSVRLDVAERLPAIKADTIQLQQVLINLVRNAIEATPADNTEREVVIHTKLDGTDFVEIAVSDSGEGLPPEREDKIFDPFFTTKVKGLGVGLSISRSIAEAHGGRLWATANAGHGTTFHLRLPILEQTQT